MQGCLGDVFRGVAPSCSYMSWHGRRQQHRRRWAQEVSAEAVFPHPHHHPVFVAGLYIESTVFTFPCQYSSFVRIESTTYTMYYVLHTTHTTYYAYYVLRILRTTYTTLRILRTTYTTYTTYCTTYTTYYILRTTREELN